MALPRDHPQERQSAGSDDLYRLAFSQGAEEALQSRVAQPDRREADPLVRLRDALAHGRVFAAGVAGHPFRLIKFEKATEANRILVEMAVVMSAAWFTEQVNLVVGAMETVEGRVR